MKKLFIVAMALATIVSCSKEEGLTKLDSSKKAISITIANGIDDTRVVVEEIAAVDTTDGGVGSIQAQAKQQVCAETNELVLLLANNAGTVEEAYALKGYTATNNTYTFHNVSESVTQVAVVRDIVDGDANVDASSYVGDALVDYRNAAANVDAMENIDITEIDLYVAAKLDPSGTCTVVDTEHNTEWTYQLYTASVEVAPTIARIEITGIACDGGTDADGVELGSTTLAAAQGKLVSGGYDELKLGGLVWGADDEYTFDLKDYVLKGIYEQGSTTARSRTDYSPGTGNAITWNIDPSAEVPQIGGNPIVMDMIASAYDYTVVNDKKTLSIGFGEAVKEFAPGNIYRFAVNFGENNLDDSNEAICVEVTVTVAKWAVVNVNPVFGN